MHAGGGKIFALSPGDLTGPGQGLKGSEVSCCERARHQGSSSRSDSMMVRDSGVSSASQGAANVASADGWRGTWLVRWNGLVRSCRRKRTMVRDDVPAASWTT